MKNTKLNCPLLNETPMLYPDEGVGSQLSALCLSESFSTLKKAALPTVTVLSWSSVTSNDWSMMRARGSKARLFRLMKEALKKSSCESLFSWVTARTPSLFVSLFSL